MHYLQSSSAVLDYYSILSLCLSNQKNEVVSQIVGHYLRTGQRQKKMLLFIVIGEHDRKYTDKKKPV